MAHKLMTALGRTVGSVYLTAIEIHFMTNGRQSGARSWREIYSACTDLRSVARTLLPSAG